MGAPFMLHYLSSSWTSVVYSNQKPESDHKSLASYLLVRVPEFLKQLEMRQLTHLTG